MEGPVDPTKYPQFREVIDEIHLGTAKRNSQKRTTLPDGKIAKVTDSGGMFDSDDTYTAYLTRDGERKQIGQGTTDYTGYDGPYMLSLDTAKITFDDDSSEVVGQITDYGLRGIVRPGEATLQIENEKNEIVYTKTVQITGGRPANPSPEPDPAPTPEPEPAQNASNGGLSDPTPSASDGQDADAQSDNQPLLASADDDTILMLAAAVGVGLAVWRMQA